MDWSPFADGDLRLYRPCGKGPDGQWVTDVAVQAPAGLLWRLGLHPAQPTSAPAGPPPPAWWGPWLRGGERTWPDPAE